MSGEMTSCRAGAARVCINPDLPADMAGYFHRRLAERVDRDIYAAAIVLENDGDYLTIVSCDLIGMTDEVCMPAFKKASAKYNVPIENFVACATHTHTGPEIRHGNCIPCNDDYVKKLPGMIEEAVMTAFDNMSEAVISVGMTDVPGLAHNRLSRCADGSEVFGGQSQGSRVIGAAGPEDTSVQTLSFYDLDKNLRALAVNFACHPDLGGGGSATAINADWPGEMCECLMKIHGPEVVCMMLQGTAGDINNLNHRASRSWLPKGASAVARGVAGGALYAMETAKVMPDAKLAALRRDLEIPYFTRNKELLDMVEEIKGKGESATYFEKNLLKDVESWEKDGKVDHYGVTCMRIGDIAIVSMPGEIFTAWGLEIKRYSPAKQTFVVELASSHDGMTGYKPSADQAMRGVRCKGGYGSLPILCQSHCQEAGQIMTEAAIELLYELWPETEG